MPSQPTDEQLLSSKAARDQLTDRQYWAFLQRLKSVVPSQPKGVIHNTPAAFAAHYSKRLSNPKYHWRPAKHLIAISDALRDVYDGNVSRLILNAPPRHGKSQMVSKWFPVWLLGKRPTTRIMLVSYEARFAEDWCVACRNLVLDFGEDLGLAVDPAQSRRDFWKVTQGGYIRSAGARGPITGKDADLIVVDDPIKDEREAASPVMRKHLWNWWTGTLQQRLEAHTAIVIMQTRWHQEDLVGKILDQEAAEWTVLSFPAIAEDGDLLGRAPGEALWPEAFPASVLMKRKATIGEYFWNAEFQQRPSPEGGGLIKRCWWRFYAALPEFDQMIQSWDTSMGDAKGSDFCVGVVLGRRGAETYVVDLIRGRMNTRDVLTAIRAWSQLYPKAMAKIVEAAASGTAVVHMLNAEIPGMKPVPARGKGSKADRLQAVLPVIEAGNVLLPEFNAQPWVGELVEEFASFTAEGSSSAHDDIVDAVVQGLRYLYPQLLRSVEIAQLEAMGERPQETVVDIRAREFLETVKNRMSMFSSRLRRKNNRHVGSFQNVKHW